MSSESEDLQRVSRRRENSRSSDTMPPISPDDTDSDPLCCCEYINDRGERTHLLGFCCDCEALDDSFERLIQGQPQPKGRFNELCAEFSDRLRFPWLRGARRVELDVILPVFILPSLLALGTLGPICTAVSFLLIPISIHIIRKCLLLKIKRTKFYCSFTLNSFLLSYLVFELKVLSFQEVSHLQHSVNIFLLCLSLGLMHQTRRKGQEDKALSSISERLPSYYFCRTCQFHVDGRDHHCVWLNCCIGKRNKPWFLVAIVVGYCWILYTINLTVKSVCHPSYYLFGTVPLGCQDVYGSFNSAVCFVTAIYGTIVLILLSMILIHQSRLVWRGVSYLDWKYAGRSPRVTKNSKPRSNVVVT